MRFSVPLYSPLFFHALLNLWNSYTTIINKKNEEENRLNGRSLFFIRKKYLDVHTCIAFTIAKQACQKKKRLKAKTYVKMGYVKWFYTSFRTINIGLNIINKKILSVKFFKF